MALDSTNPDFDAWVADWQLMRDVLAGERAVKDAGSLYLPMLSGQDAGEYEAYKKRAAFHEATARTLDGLCGAVFRKPPQIDAPDAAEGLLDNVTGRGAPLEVFAKGLVREAMAVGRYGVLVDLPQSGGEPYQAGYVAESIINWRVTIVDGRPRLSLVVLAETAEAAGEDEYEREERSLYRVLRLDEAGFYTQELWEKTEGSKEDVFTLLEGPFRPVRSGVALKFIPFQFFGPMHLQPGCQKPPLLGLANVNLSHYRTSADLEHGAHFTALPTPWISGGLAGQKGAEGQGQVRIGSGVAWMLTKDSQAGMLEYTGQGLEALEKRLERKEKHMAVLGARLLEDQKTQTEAFQTVSMRHQGENSMLASVADTVGRGLTNTTNWQLWWNGGGETDATIELNKDFIERALTPQEMVHLVAGWQQGGYGGEALFFNLQQGERLPDGWTLDDWKKDIEENGAGNLFGDALGGGEEPDPSQVEDALAGSGLA